MSKLKTILLVMVFLLAVPVSSTFAVQIDFSDSIFKNNLQYKDKTEFTTTIDGLDVTLKSRWANDIEGINGAPVLTYNDSDNDNAFDGIGAHSFNTQPDQSYEYDEIEENERVIVEFGESVQIIDFSVTDLFYENDFTHDPDTYYTEEGYFRLLIGGAWIDYDPFIAPTTNFPSSYGPNYNGYLQYIFDPNTITVIDAIMFYAPGLTDNRLGTYEFSLAEINVKSAPVPEPATMLLLGIGLLGIATANRKKIKDR